MKLNNKGFTLVEVLGVIVILGIIAMITIFSTINIIGSVKENSYKTTINNIQSEANNYVTEEVGSGKWMIYDGTSNEYQCVSVQNLIDTGYFDKEVLNAEVSKDRKVKSSDNVFLLRDGESKSIIKSILDYNGVLGNFCSNYDADYNISFISDNNWAKKKDIGIEYSIYNVPSTDSIVNYKYEYNYKVNESIIDNKIENFDYFEEKVDITVYQNGLLTGKINDKNGNVKLVKTLDVNTIDNISPVGSISSTNNFADNQKVTLELRDNESGVKEYYFGKKDPDRESLDWILSSGGTKNTNVSSEGKYYLAIKDKVDNVSVTNKDFYRTTLFVTDGSVSVNEIITMEGNSITLPTPTLEHSYHEFVGWYDNASYSGSAITNYTPVSNKTLYAKLGYRTYTITYNCGIGNGTVPAPQTVKYNSNFTILSNSGACSKAGYKFEGWYDSTSYEWTGSSGLWQFEDGEHGIKDRTIVLTAKWVDGTAPNGSITSTNNVASSQTVTLTMKDNETGVKEYYFGIDDPSKTSVSFTPGKNGQVTTLVSSSGTYYLAIKDNASNVRIISKKFYKTSLSISNATVKPKEIITMEGNSITLPIPTVSYSYQVFVGWYDNTSYSGSAITNYTPVSNKTIYGKLDYRTYTITYNCGIGSGTAPVPQNVKYNSNFTILSNSGACSNTGYDFDGWYDSTSYEWTGRSGLWQFEDGEHGIKDRTIVLTAKWVDGTAPKLTVVNTVDGSIYSGSWTNKTVKSELNFSDSGSGIKSSSLVKSEDNKNWTNLNNTSTTKFIDSWTKTKNGKGYYKVCDNSNNCTVVEVMIRIDKQAPTTPSITIDDKDSFSYISTDSDSGIAGYYISTSNTEPSVSSSSWTSATIYNISSYGTYFVWAKDYAGNISNVSSVELKPKIAKIGSCSDLKYNGTNQTLITSGENVIYQNNTGLDAGTYEVIVNSKDGYEFDDGSTTKKVTCSIGKASGYIELNVNSGTLEYQTSEKLFKVESHHGGTLSVTFEDGDDNVDAIISGDNIRLVNLDMLDVYSSLTVIVKSSATNNYTEASAKYVLSVVPSSKPPSLVINNPYNSTNWYNKAALDSGKLYKLTLYPTDYSGTGIAYYEYKKPGSSTFIRYSSCDGKSYCVTDPWIENIYGKTVTLKVCDNAGNCTEGTTQIYRDVTPPNVTCCPREITAVQTVTYYPDDNEYRCQWQSLEIEPYIDTSLKKDIKVNLKVSTDPNNKCSATIYVKNCKGSFQPDGASMCSGEPASNILKKEWTTEWVNDSEKKVDAFLSNKCDCIKGFCSMRYTYTVTDKAGNVGSNTFTYKIRYDDWETFQGYDVCKNK